MAELAREPRNSFMSEKSLHRAFQTRKSGLSHREALSCVSDLKKSFEIVSTKISANCTIFLRFSP